MIDGTMIRAHRHASGARGGQESPARGRSCGGFSSKIHRKVDALGMPLGFIITAGQNSDIGQGEALLGDDSDPFRKILLEKGITPVIPGRKSRKVTIQYDEHTYKKRNAVERFFGRIKEFRRIATRYDKKTCMFKGVSCSLRSSYGVNFEDQTYDATPGE